MMEYYRLLKKTFPGQEVCIDFSDRGDGLQITIQASDYVLSTKIQQPLPGEELIRREIGYMIEAIKGALDERRAKRKLP